MDEVRAIAANGLMNAALASAVIQKLTEKGLLNAEDVREIYETALQMLERQQGVSPASQEIFAIARELIEQHLRPGRKP